MTPEEQLIAIGTAQDIRMRYPSSMLRIRTSHVPTMFYVSRGSSKHVLLVTKAQAIDFARRTRHMERHSRKFPVLPRKEAQEMLHKLMKEGWGYEPAKAQVARERTRRSNLKARVKRVLAQAAKERNQ